MKGQIMPTSLFEEHRNHTITSLFKKRVDRNETKENWINKITTRRNKILSQIDESIQDRKERYQLTITAWSWRS